MYVFMCMQMFLPLCVCVSFIILSTFFSSGFPLLLAVRVSVCVCVDGYVLDGCDSLLLLSLCVKTLKKKCELHPTFSLFSICPNAHSLFSTDRSVSYSFPPSVHMVPPEIVGIACNSDHILCKLYSQAGLIKKTKLRSDANGSCYYNVFSPVCLHIF